MFSSCRVLLILASSGFISPSVNSKLTFFFFFPLRIHPFSFGYSTLGLSTKDRLTFFFFLAKK